MQIIQEPSFILKPADYKLAIKNNQHFYIQFNLFTPEVEATFMKIVHRLLEKDDLLYLKEIFVTVLREIITNAIKANTKRLYFKLMNLDINKKDDYRTGMETFKRDVYGSETDIFEKLKKVNLCVRVVFDNLPEGLKISIINNAPILEVERIKIESRIRKANSYEDISEAFEDVMDDSEGAGLGLIMALMLFKNAGFSTNTFQITGDDYQTSAIISTPQSIDREHHHFKIAEELTKELEKIPSFPENIIEIQRLCSDPKSTVKEISERIKRDPGLTTSLLKLANSAGYITLYNCKTIEEAVKLIGMETINTFLVATGVQKILNTRYKKFENIWHDSYRAAFYAHTLSTQSGQAKSSEFIYLSALLADIGQIILLSVRPELTQKFKEIAGTRLIEDSGLLEEMSLGLSHSTLGSLVCEKWKFDESLVTMIKYHHRPYMSPLKYKTLIYFVYLAYSMVDIENKKIRFEILDEDILEFFNLLSKDKFENLHGSLKNVYETQYNKI